MAASSLVNRLRALLITGGPSATQVCHVTHVLPTWAEILHLVEALDTVAELCHGLLCVRSRLDLKQEDGSGDVDAICERQYAVIHRKGAAEEVEDGNDGRRRCNTCHQVALDLGAALICPLSPACEHGAIEQNFECVVETADSC